MTFTRNLRTACAIVASVLALTGCTSIPVEHLPRATALPLVDDPQGASDPVYRIRPGDDLDIKFFYTRELNESVKVRPDGMIALQLVDEVKAAGLTPKELDDQLTERYAAHVKTPVLSVLVRSFSGFRAYVGGEVGVPQLVPLDGGLTPMQAIFRAGGVRPSANMQSIILIRKGPQGEPIPYRLDLSDNAVAQGNRDLRIALQPSDVVYVPRSPIANANLFVQQYVSDLLLFRGLQLGFTTNYIYNRERNGVLVP